MFKLHTAAKKNVVPFLKKWKTKVCESQFGNISQTYIHVRYYRLDRYKLKILIAWNHPLHNIWFSSPFLRRIYMCDVSYICEEGIHTWTMKTIDIQRRKAHSSRICSTPSLSLSNIYIQQHKLPQHKTNFPFLFLLIPSSQLRLVALKTR